MVHHKTRKHHRTSKKSEGIYSIPELRRSFEHIEDFLIKKINVDNSHSNIIKDFQKEWKKVFHKEIDKKSAEAYVDHVIIQAKSATRSLRNKTQKHKGGSNPVAGAPLNYTVRAGLYPAPGQIPPNAYGDILEYVSKGFWNPEQGHSYDPVPGQTHYVTSVPKGMGDNTVHFTAKGGKRLTRKLRKSGGTRLIPASVPASILQDAQDIFLGKQVGSSPDQTERQANYK
jgi:hypothetical protein